VFPSYRDLAERYGVSTTLVAKYAKDHNCIRRRSQAKARIQAQADQKLVELRATAVALSKDDELRIIDSYLSGFEKALSEGRVRFDNPGDFNTMVRLKEFVMGGADSRQELHASLSLEDIQARHHRMFRVVNEAGLPARGELPGPTGVVLDATPVEGSAPPHGPIADAAGDLNVQLQEAETCLVEASSGTTGPASVAPGPLPKGPDEHLTSGAHGPSDSRANHGKHDALVRPRADAGGPYRVLPRVPAPVETSSGAPQVPAGSGQLNTRSADHFGPDSEVPNGR
jgi:hypothetical protein